MRPSLSVVVACILNNEICCQYLRVPVLGCITDASLQLELLNVSSLSQCILPWHVFIISPVTVDLIIN